MPRPIWPPEYANVSLNVLLADGVPDAAFRFYGKLRALSWGDDTFSMNFDRLMELVNLSQTRIYEYARLLRLNRGLLSYAVRNNVFECSFPSASATIPASQEIPVIREKPSSLIQELNSSQNKSQKNKGLKAVNPINREKPNYYPMALCLSDVCHMQLAANRGKLFKECQRMVSLEPTPTPELVREHYNGATGSYWYSQDWRGKRGEFPTPAAIRETWGRWAETPKAVGAVGGMLAYIERLENGDAI